MRKPAPFEDELEVAYEIYTRLKPFEPQVRDRLMRLVNDKLNRDRAEERLKFQSKRSSRG